MIALWHALKTKPCDRTPAQKRELSGWLHLVSWLLILSASLLFDPSGNTWLFLWFLTVIYCAASLSFRGWKFDDEIKYPTCEHCGGLRLCKGHEVPRDPYANLVPRYPGDFWSSAEEETPTANPTIESSGTRHQGND